MFVCVYICTYFPLLRYTGLGTTSFPGALIGAEEESSGPSRWASGALRNGHV